MSGTAPGFEAATGELVYRERVRILFAGALLPVYFNLANALILGLLMIGRAAPSLILGWVGASVAINAGRMALLWQYRRRPNVLEPRQWAHTVTLTNGLNGLHWAASAFLFASHADPIATAYVVFFIGGMTAAASMRMAVFPLTAMAFALPPLIGLAAFLFAGPGWQPKLMAIVILMFAVATTRIIRLTADSLQASIEQGFVNQQLAGSLGKALVQAQAAQRTQSAFIANISHEIRTPMNAVMGMIDLAKTADDKAEQTEMLDIAHKAASALLELLNDILDLSRLAQGALKVEKTEIDPATLIRDISGLMQVGAHTKGLALYHDAADACPVMADGNRIRQILINLVGNAIKFTQAGSVRITARVRRLSADGGAVLEVAITDTGVGIAPEDKERIFLRFQQGDSSMTRRFQGTGLGLAISRELAELMGGRLDVESAPGEGSCFTLRVPVEPVAAAKLSAGGIAQGSAIHVLVVDDNDINRRLFAKIIESAGSRATLAESGEQALALLSHGPGAAPGARFDLVLMDIKMPGMDGFAAARHIRDLGNGYSDIPIIAVSADDYGDETSSLRMAGFDGFIGKPVDAAKLIQMIGGGVGMEMAMTDKKAAIPVKHAAL